MKHFFLIIYLLCFFFLSAQAQLPKSQYIPDVDEYIEAKREPIAMNFSLIRDKIGYPTQAAKEKVQGKVFTRVLVDTEGKVFRFTITRSDHPALKKAVEREIESLKFLPALKDDSLIYFWTNVSFLFSPNMGQHIKAQKYSYKTLVQKLFKSNKQKSQDKLTEGIALFQQRDYKEAGRCFKDCIVSTPQPKSSRSQEILFQAYYFLGHCYTQLRAWELADRYYTEAIGMSRSMKKPPAKVEELLPSLHLGRGYVLLKAGESQRALSDYNWVTHQYPQIFDQGDHKISLPPYPWRTNGDWINYQKGLLYLQLEKSAEAIAHFEEVEKYNPQDHLKLVTLSHKGLAKSKLGDFEGAFNDIQAAIDLNEEDPQPYFLKAMILMELESQEMATEILEQARELFAKVEYTGEIPAMFPKTEE